MNSRPSCCSGGTNKRTMLRNGWAPHFGTLFSKAVWRSGAWANFGASGPRVSGLLRMMATG